MTVDPESFKLALHFLRDPEDPPQPILAVEAQSLAEAIQRAVEDWFGFRPEVPDEPEPAPTQAERHEWKQMEMEIAALAEKERLAQEPEP